MVDECRRMSGFVAQTTELCALHISRRVRAPVTYLFRWRTVFSMALLLAACTRGGTGQTRVGGEPQPWPTGGWQLSSPEAQGMDSVLLADMLAEIEQGYLHDAT